MKAILCLLLSLLAAPLFAQSPNPSTVKDARVAFAEGAKAEGKRSANPRIHAEAFVFVGEKSEAVAAA